MAELRYHPFIKDWVMIASHRQGRPNMPNLEAFLDGDSVSRVFVVWGESSRVGRARLLSQRIKLLLEEERKNIISALEWWENPIPGLKREMEAGMGSSVQSLSRVRLFATP